MSASEPSAQWMRDVSRWWSTWPAWAFVVIALVELIGHARIVSSVAKQSDWAGVGEVLSEQWREGDTLVVAPDWLDPVLRKHFGDRIPLSHAGRSDLAPFERLWVVAARGRRSSWEPDARDPAIDERFGQLRLRRWDLGPTSVVYDLTSHVQDAEVSRGERRCTWRRTAPSGGGLGRGPLFPAEHHFCGPEPWVLVGETVNEDLELQPRHCVWQHPVQGEPIRTLFRDVPLGERLVLYGGIYYEHERMREHGPVTARILVGGRELGRLEHRDGDGWERLEVPTSGGRGDVAIEVIADAAHLRTMCWAATTRGPARELGER